MEERVEREIVEQKVWIANDGQKFTSEKACTEYEERNAKDKAKKIAHGLPHFDYTIAYADDDFGWEWYFVSNAEELDAVRTDLYQKDSTAWEYVPANFPCWLACSVDAYGYGYIEGTPEEVFGVLKKFEIGVLAEIGKAGANEADRR